MQKLVEVEEAKAVMIEAIDWSVIKWLREKKRVRKAADRANEALDQAIEAAKLRWDPELLAVYAAVTSSRNGMSAKPELQAMAKDLKRVHEEARRARDEAERVFDEAEKELSARLAREGCRKAIHSWELHEKVIRKAEVIGD